MTKIAIIGANNFGTAIAKILLATTDFEVVLIDHDEDDLKASYLACADIPRSAHSVALSPTIPVETFVAHGKDQLEATLRSLKPTIVCSTMSDADFVSAEIANRLGCHYVGFARSDSNLKSGQIIQAIKDLNVSRLTFVPQTGLLHGFAASLGLSLFDELAEPLSLSIRAGSVPQISFRPGHFAITEEPRYIIENYLGQSLCKRQGTLEEVPALDDHEEIIVSGVGYEAFTIADGLGDVEAFEHIPSVDAKVVRHKGHMDFIQKSLSKVGYDEDDSIALLQQTFTTTMDDVVVVAAEAVDLTGFAATVGMHIYPCEPLSLSAFDLVSAGTACAVIELLIAEKLPAGVISAKDISFNELSTTAAFNLVFEYLD